MLRNGTKAAAVLLMAIQVAICSITAAGRATADTVAIKVASANVLEGVLDGLVAEFERTTGHKVGIAYATAGVIRNRIRDGEAADVVILPRPMMEELQRQGRIPPGAVPDLARSAVGVAVRRGTPKPDISSVDAFKRSLLAASSISYADPARGGATGVLITRVLDHLGLTGQMKPKTVFPPAGQLAVQVVARGDAEVALTQPMEVLSQPSLDLVGLLPSELQSPADFTFSVSVIANAPQPQLAAALVAFLEGPTARAVLKMKGMEPG